jgi:hypothetical protein
MPAADGYPISGSDHPQIEVSLMLAFGQQGKPALHFLADLTQLFVDLCRKIRRLTRADEPASGQFRWLKGSLTMTHFRSQDGRQMGAPVAHFYCFNLQPEDMMALSAHLNELSEKHRQLEVRIAEEAARPLTDTVKLNRLKLEKLKLKDEITKLSQTRH